MDVSDDCSGSDRRELEDGDGDDAAAAPPPFVRTMFAQAAGEGATVFDDGALHRSQQRPEGTPRKCDDHNTRPSSGVSHCSHRGSTRPEDGCHVGSDGDDNSRGISLTEWIRNSSNGGGGRRRGMRRRRRGTSGSEEQVNDDDGTVSIAVDNDSGDDHGDDHNIRDIRRAARLAWAIADAVARLHESEDGLGGGGVSRRVIGADDMIVFDCGVRKRNVGEVLRVNEDDEDPKEDFRVEFVVDTYTGAASFGEVECRNATSKVADELRSLGLVLREVFLAASGGSGYVPRSVSTLVSRLLMKTTPSDPENVEATTVATTSGHADYYRSVRAVERDLCQMVEFPERFLPRPPPPPPAPSSPVERSGDEAAVTMMTQSVDGEGRTRPQFPSDVIYGRDAEASVLLEACADLVVTPQSPQTPSSHRPRSRGMVLVSGASGTGKSSLVRWMRDRAVRMGAQCLLVRFEPPTRARPVTATDEGGGVDGPFSALVSALGGYFEDVLLDPAGMGDDAVSVDSLRSHLLEEGCGGPEGLSVLIRLIPPLGRFVIGSDWSLPPTSAEEVFNDADHYGHGGVSGARRRRDLILMHLLPTLIAAIASRRPLVLVLDDLQCADEASLDVVKAVIAADGGSGGGRRSVLFVGCHREGVGDGMVDGHQLGEMDEGPVKVFLRDFGDRESSPPITRIRLDGISRDAVNLMVSDALGAPRSTTAPLTDVVHSVTGGNPLHVVRYVTSLFDGGALQYSHDSASWVWSLDEILSRRGKSGGHGDAVVDREGSSLASDVLLGLSTEGRGALELAACLGPHCSEEVLRLIAEDEDHPRTGKREGHEVGRADAYSTIVATLDAAVRHGLMARTTAGGTYRYVDERVRHAAYGRLPEGERGALHARIGWRIYKRSSPEELQRLLLVAAEHLHLGLAFIERRDKIDASRFFLRAGKMAMSMSLFLPASTYLGAGMDLLDGGHWDDNYELNLELYDAGAEIEYCNGNFDRMGIIIDIILAHARTFEERLGAYSTLVNALGAQDKVREAIETGFIVLEGLGEQFPSEDVAASLHMREWMKTRDMLDGFTDETLVTMRLMEDAGKIAAMRFLNTILLYTYIVKKEYLPLVVFRMVQLTLLHGISKESAIAFAMYGYLSCGTFGDIKRGYQFGQMALVLLDRFGSHDCVARAYQIIYGFIHHWSAHIRQCLEPLSLGYRTGMVFGDIEYALGNARLFCICSFFSGRNLHALEDEMNVFCQEMARYKQQRILAVLAITRQTVQNLRGETDDPVCLTGDFMNQKQMLNRARSKNVLSTACFIYMHCLWLAHLYGDFLLAAEMAEKSRNVDELCSAGMVMPSHAFFDGLTSLALARKTKERKWKILADEALKKMTDWAAHAPCNFQHKIALLEAEFSFLTGDCDEAKMAYDVSITIAGQNGFIHEQALACEKAAIFHFECGDRSKSSHYFDQAHSLYLEWGALAKVNHLRRLSLEFLAPNTAT